MNPWYKKQMRCRYVITGNNFGDLVDIEFLGDKFKFSLSGVFPNSKCSFPAIETSGGFSDDLGFTNINKALALFGQELTNELSRFATKPVAKPPTIYGMEMPDYANTFIKYFENNDDPFVDGNNRECSYHGEFKLTSTEPVVQGRVSNLSVSPACFVGFGFSNREFIREIVDCSDSECLKDMTLFFFLTGQSVFIYHPLDIEFDKFAWKIEEQDFKSKML